jgi:hypothetical protein
MMAGVNSVPLKFLRGPDLAARPASFRILQPYMKVADRAASRPKAALTGTLCG